MWRISAVQAGAVPAVAAVGDDRAGTTVDVRRACDVLRPVYEATGGVDGRCRSVFTARGHCGRGGVVSASPGRAR